MPRPQKTRYVTSHPEMNVFGPCKNDKNLGNGAVHITVEEFETIRLSDYECLDQESAAEMMGVSRHTYGRLLSSARKIVAKALVAGMTLRIEGGNYQCRPQGQQRRCGRGQGRGMGQGRGGRRR